jgi:MFS superfamily sulfate permease-like transporter
MSLLMMLRHLSRSAVVVLGRLGQGHDYVDCARHPAAQAVPGMLILRPEEALFFANAERIIMQAQAYLPHGAPAVDTVILSLEESPDLDSTSLQALHEFTQFIAAQNCQLVFARLKSPVHAALVRLAAGDPPEAYLTELSVDDAVAAALRLREERQSERRAAMKK